MEKNAGPDQARNYIIRVRGQLSPRWLEFFGNLDPHAQVEADGTTLITLSGEFIDQAALHGALQSLYNLGCILVSVEIQN